MKEGMKDELSEILERIHVEMTDSAEEEGVLKLRIFLKNANEAETHQVMSELQEAIRQKKFYLLANLFPKQTTLFKALKKHFLPSHEIIVPDKLDHDGSLSVSIITISPKNELSS